ncbi:hypothetical protein CVT26_010378 [Gymnopilus dilepis]|uniref:Uncharacterized protein n=1 Tax=Gymnopilus dilepis TaxID=231916 RepID=A0A409WZG1_9AGAR|nr:hypothetical protein CVT26_010378 [Gymnopilus dilepis]
MEHLIDILDNANKDCLDAFQSRREQDLLGLLQELRIICRIVAKQFSLCSDSQRQEYGRYMNIEKPFARAAWLYFTEYVTLFRDLSIPMSWHDKLRPRDHARAELSGSSRSHQAISSGANHLMGLESSGPSIDSFLDDQKVHIPFQNCSEGELALRPKLVEPGVRLSLPTKTRSPIRVAEKSPEKAVESATLGYSNSSRFLESAPGNVFSGAGEDSLEDDHLSKRLSNISADGHVVTNGKATDNPEMTNSSIKPQLPVAAIESGSDLEYKSVPHVVAPSLFSTQGPYFPPLSPPPPSVLEDVNESLASGFPYKGTSSIHIEAQSAASLDMPGHCNGESELAEVCRHASNSNVDEALGPFTEASTEVSKAATVDIRRMSANISPLTTEARQDLSLSPRSPTATQMLQGKVDNLLESHVNDLANEVKSSTTALPPSIENVALTVEQSSEVKSKAVICWIPVEEIAPSGSCKRCIDKQEACKISYDLIRDGSNLSRRKISRGVCNNCQISHLRCYWNDAYFKPCPKKGHIHIPLAKSAETKIWCESPAAKDEEQQLLQPVNVPSNPQLLNDSKVQVEAGTGVVSSLMKPSSSDMLDECLSQPCQFDIPRRGSNSGTSNDHSLQGASIVDPKEGDSRKRPHSVFTETPLVEEVQTVLAINLQQTTTDESEQQSRKRLRSRLQSGAKDSQPSWANMSPSDQTMNVDNVKDSRAPSISHSSQSIQELNKPEIHVSSEDTFHGEPMPVSIVDVQSLNPLDFGDKEGQLVCHMDNTDSLPKCKGKQHVRFADEQRKMNSTPELMDLVDEDCSKTSGLS